MSRSEEKLLRFAQAYGHDVEHILTGRIPRRVLTPRRRRPATQLAPCLNIPQSVVDLELRILAHLTGEQTMSQTFDMLSVPPGQYTMRITNCTLSDYGESGVRIRYRCEVVDEVRTQDLPNGGVHKTLQPTPHAGGEAVIFHCICGLHGVAQLKAMIEACSVPLMYHDSVAPEEFEGRIFVGTVTHRKHGAVVWMDVQPMVATSAGVRQGKICHAEVEGALLSYTAADALATADYMHMLPADPPAEQPEVSDSAFCQCASPQPVLNGFGTVSFHTCEGCKKEIETP